MEVVIYNAISLDGYIATMDGGTDWVQDWDLFESICKEFGCVVMGRNTFDEGGSVFEGVQHIVLTSAQGQSKEDNVYFINSVEQAIEKAKELKSSKLLVIGGAKTNEAFMRSGVVNRLIVDLHSLMLGTGVPIFGGFSESVVLGLQSSETYPENFIHMEYEMVGKKS